MADRQTLNRRDFLKTASVSTGGILLAGCRGASTPPHDTGETASSLPAVPLRFNDKGTFKIVQLTDTHWYDGRGDDQRTEQLIGEIVAFEKPDLIVLTGDVISGKDADSASAQRDILTKVASHRVPWALVFGNHDDEGSCTREQLWEIAASIPYSCCPATVANLSGVSNYVLTVDSAKTSRPAYVLVMLDSNGYSPEKEIEGYGWIMPDQIEWFRQCSDRYRTGEGGTLPALAFYHIPVPEYATIWEHGLCVGEKNEDVCSASINSGFFAAALEQNNVRGMFVGHDHVNDYEGQIAGVRFCYGRKTGFRSYSRDGFAKGARVIELTEGRQEFKTWVVVEGLRRIVYGG